MRLAPIATLVAVALLAAVTAAGVAGGPAGGAERAGEAPAERVIYPGHEREVMALLAPLVAHGFRGRAVDAVPIARDEVRVQLADRAPGDGGARPSATGCDALPAWARPPGALVLAPRAVLGPAHTAQDGHEGVAAGATLALAWHLCGSEAAAAGPAAVTDEARARLAEITAAGDPDAIWGAPPVIAPRARPAAGDGAAHSEGLLTPTARALGVGAGALVSLAFALGFALAVAVAALSARPNTRALEPPPVETTRPPRAAPRPADRRRARIAWAAALALFAAGAALRVHAAARTPLDGDEPWALPSPHAVLGDDHDAWVHPPVFRAVQQRWVRAIGWRPGRGLLALRGVSLLASVAALALLAATAARAGATGTHPAVVATFAAPALAPAVVHAGVLARPYALAAALVVACAAALWTDDGDATDDAIDDAPHPGGGAPSATAARRARGVRLAAALCAMGLAAWTDLLAGLAAGACVAAALLARSRARPGAVPRGRGARVAVALAACAWLAPLAPGALVAARTQVRPAPHAAASPARPARGPDLRPVNGMGRGAPGAFVAAVAQFAALGRETHGLAPIALLAAAWVALVGVAHARRGRTAVALALALTLALVLLAGTRVGLRPRNVLFLPHLVALAAAGAWVSRPSD